MFVHTKNGSIHRPMIGNLPRQFEEVYSDVDVLA
jgi:hypothetical protein